MKNDLPDFSEFVDPFALRIPEKSVAKTIRSNKACDICLWERF
jgi:hypothetical protein